MESEFWSSHDRMDLILWQEKTVPLSCILAESISGLTRIWSLLSYKAENTMENYPTLF